MNELEWCVCCGTVPVSTSRQQQPAPEAPPGRPAPQFSWGPRPQPALPSQPALRSIPFSSFTNKPHPSTTTFVFPSTQLTLSLNHSLISHCSASPQQPSPLSLLSLIHPPQKRLPHLQTKALSPYLPVAPLLILLLLLLLLSTSLLYSFPPTPWTNKSAAIPLTKSF